jgi:hypothetical protein
MEQGRLRESPPGAWPFAAEYPSSVFPYDWVPWAGADLIPDLVLGLRMIRVLTNQSWVHRRVDSAKFEGEWIIRRRVSVDFTLPESSAASRLPHLVPLALVQKRALVGFDVRDEADHPIPLLTKPDNNWVAWSSLTAWAVLLARRAGRSLTQDQADRLWSVVSGYPTRAVPEIAWLGGLPWLQSDTGKVFRKFAEDLAWNFLLIVPVDPEPARRRVLKFSFSEALPPPKDPLVSRLAWSVGWAPTPFSAETHGLSGAPSYHFELVAPEGMVCVGARIDAHADLGHVEAYSSGGPPFVHIHARQAPPDAWAIIKVGLRAPVRGVLRQATVAVSVIALLLVLGIAFFNRLVFIGNERSDAAAAILVGLAVVSLYVSRPGEHMLMSRAVFGVRLIAVMAAVATLGAALILVEGPSRGWLLGLWSVLTGLTVLGMVTLWITFVKASRHHFPGPPRDTLMHRSSN